MRAVLDGFPAVHNKTHLWKFSIYEGKHGGKAVTFIGNWPEPVFLITRAKTEQLTQNSPCKPKDE